MRYLVLSDIHSNLEAFQAVLDDAGPVDRVWCLGDVVGYGPEPNACVELLRSLPHLCIAGNHDWATLGKLDLRDFNPDARDANLWNRKELTLRNLAYLEALTEVRVEGQFTLIHGSPRHPIWEYIIYPSTAKVNFEHFATPYCFSGHTHTPVIFRLCSPDAGSPDAGSPNDNSQNNGSQNAEPVVEALPPALDEPLKLGPERLIINPGSVGQPRDGDPRASYLVLDDEAMTIQHHRVAYPVEETQAKMMEYNLPMRLVLRLGYGW